MLELAARLVPLIERGDPLAVATSIDVIGSAPHLVGTSLAVTAGAVLGSVSNGCVESAALADCRALLAGGSPVWRRYGFGDAEAAVAGLSCGGELDVLVHPLGREALPVLRAAARGEVARLAVVTAGIGLGSVVDAPPLDASGSVELDCDGEVRRLFVDVAAPARRMVIVGATETAAALARAAAAVGYLVTVCDPRPALAAGPRFPGARVEIGLPHRVLAGADLGPRDAVCLLSHDQDLDPLALAQALESAAGYVGALGSRTTTARRAQRLHALGVADAAIARLHAPIGLDLGASTPAETAVSILAEVIAARVAASGDPLRTRTGPLHAHR